MVHFDLDKLEDLPQKQPFHPKWRHRTENTFGKRNPDFTAEKIIKNNIGKSYDIAFSYFCKKVKQQDQKEFIDWFNWRYSRYIIDELGLIQFHPSRLPVIKESKRTFTSNDIEYKIIHKDSGLAKELFNPVEIIVGYKEVLENRWYCRGKKQRNYRKQEWVIKPIKKQIGYLYSEDKKQYVTKQLPLYKQIFAKDSDFIKVISKGIELKFDSPKTPQLVRLRKEALKKHNRSYKRKYNLDIIDYDFILKQGSQRLEKENNDKLLSAKEMAAKLKQENDIKILAHGFDLETSFRTVISWKKSKKSKQLSEV
jgi:hypothetical protein